MATHILTMVASNFEAAVMHVAEATQSSRGHILLRYTDGTTERGKGIGKVLGRLDREGNVLPGDFACLADVVEHVQRQRPATTILHKEESNE